MRLHLRGLAAGHGVAGAARRLPSLQRTLSAEASLARHQRDPATVTRGSQLAVISGTNSRATNSRATNSRATNGRDTGSSSLAR